MNYGWIEFPIAYTQVATIAVYCYFGATLFGRQYLIPRGVHLDNTTFPAISNSTFPTLFSNSKPFSNHTPDFVIPFFTILEFLCYMGWIKVNMYLYSPCKSKCTRTSSSSVGTASNDTIYFFRLPSHFLTHLETMMKIFK